MVVDEELFGRLASLPLFASLDRAILEDFFGRVAIREFGPGDVVVQEGDPATHFHLVVAGEAEVSSGGGSTRIGAAGPGSMIGELGLMRGAARNATVTAVTTLLTLRGGQDALTALLGIATVRERLTRQAAAHLAGSISPVEVPLRDGQTVALRPVLPDDAATLSASLDRVAPETRRLRFFSPAPLPPAMIRYLTDIDYGNHFAWTVVPRAWTRGADLGTGRFVRQIGRDEVAEVALIVFDGERGRGIGRLLLGAIGVAAAAAGIDRFEADILRDNAASLGLFRALGAEKIAADSTSLRFGVDVERFVETLAPTTAESLDDLATKVLSLARMAIA